MCSVKTLADLVKSMFIKKRLSKRYSWDYLLQCPCKMDRI